MEMRGWSAKRERAVAEGDNQTAASRRAARSCFALQLVGVIVLAACGAKGTAHDAGENSGPAVNTAVSPPAPELPAAYPIAVVANAACALDGQVYVTGGYGHRDEQGNAEFVSRAYRYDPDANLWERLPDMPVARCFHGCAAAGGKVWLFGGLSRAGTAESVTQVDCYDPASGKWTTPTNLPTPRNRLAVAAVGSAIYVAGGMSHEDSAAVEILDTSTLAWSDGPDLPHPCHGLALAPVGGSIVAAGGSHDRVGTEGARPDSVWVLKHGSWRRGASLPGAYLFAAAAALDGRMYLLGNRSRGDIPLLRYDIAGDRWEKLADKSVETHRAAAAVLDGRIYVIAGEGPDGSELSRLSIYDTASGVWRHSP